MKKPTSEIEKLDAEIQREQGVKQDQEKGLADDITAQESDEKERGEISYQALTSSDDDATRRLGELENTLATRAQRIVSRQRAIAVSAERIAALREQRSDAQRREQLEKYNHGIADLMSAAGDFEVKLLAFITQKEAVENKFSELNKLSFGLFGEGAVPHRNVQRGFRWALEQRLNLDSPYRPADFRKRYREPLPDIFNRILNHGDAVSDDDKQAEPEASTKKAKSGNK